MHEASAGREALEVCQRDSDGTDLMLSDVVMPKMSVRGFDFLDGWVSAPRGDRYEEITHPCHR